MRALPADNATNSKAGRFFDPDARPAYSFELRFLDPSAARSSQARTYRSKSVRSSTTVTDKPDLFATPPAAGRGRLAGRVGRRAWGAVFPMTYLLVTSS